MSPAECAERDGRFLEHLSRLVTPPRANFRSGCRAAMKRDNICIYVSRVSRARLEAIVADRNSRVLTDRGTEYCGRPESHEYELCLAIESIDHTRTKTRSPQTNGICERFHNTLLDESYRVAFRKRPYRTIAELQTDLDAWLAEYNETRPHRMADQRQALSAAKRRSPQL